MQQLKTKVLIMLVILFGGCASRSGVSTVKTQEDLNDVYLLSIFIQDYFRNTDDRSFTLEELTHLDSLDRIAKNFERIEQVNRGGHIAVLYRFSGRRNSKIDLTDKERQRISNLKAIEKKYNDSYDGEIQYEYGERFYHLRKIIVKKNNTSK